MVKGDAQRRTQAKPARILSNSIDAEALPNLIEVHVSRLGYRLTQIEAAMTALFPTVKDMVAKGQAARTRKASRRRNNFLLQRGGGHNDFERGARRVLSLNGAIAQGMQRIFHEALPFFPSNPP